MRRSATPTPPAPDTRERILVAALATFAEQGFDGATTRDIAARAGANLGLLQYYFGGKERLWKAAIEHAFGELRAALATVLATEIASPAQLAGVVRICVRFAARNPQFIRLMNDEGKRDNARMRWLADRHGKPLYQALAAITARARAQGLLPDLPAAHFYYILIGATGMMFSQAPECRRITGVDPARADVVEQHADALVTLLLDGAGAGAGSAPAVRRRLRQRAPGRRAS